MLRSLGGSLRILAATWPLLLAWYLGGTLVRTVVLDIAAPLGPTNALLALIIVPVAVLARLVSYIGMFLVLRPFLPGFRHLAGDNVGSRSWRDAVADFVEVLLVAVLPFFTLYALLGLLQGDFEDYARRAYAYSGFGTEGNVLDVGGGPLVALVVAVAFAGRVLLKRFGSKLPRGFAVIEIYLEATWVFVALSGLSALFADAIAFVSGRQLGQWISDARAFVTGLWEPIARFVEGVDGLVPLAAQLVLLPLAWLLIGGLIYSRALAGAVEENVLSRRLVVRLRARAASLPPALARQRYLVTDEWDDVGRPLAVAGRLIGLAGAVNLAVFMAVYALLFAAGQWLTRGLYVLVGPHELAFWTDAYQSVLTVVACVVEPIRIVVVAAAFDFCLRAWSDRRNAAAAKALSRSAGSAAAAAPAQESSADPLVPELAPGLNGGDRTA